MKDDYPDYDEWFNDFLTVMKIYGHRGPFDKERVRGYWEVDGMFPEEAAAAFRETIRKD